MLRDCLRLLVGAVTVLGMLTCAGHVWAQPEQRPPGGQFGGFGRGFGPSGEPVVSVAGQFTMPAADEPAQLFITATIKPGWHIYSITQAPGGPIATTIKLAASEAYRLTGDFQAAALPEKKAEARFGGLIVETHDGQITWRAPIELSPGVDAATLKIEGAIRAQPCDASSCMPPQDFPFTATLGPGVALSRPTGPGATPPAEPGQAAAAEGPRFRPDQVQPEETVEATSIAAALLFAFFGGLILNVMPCVLPVIGLKILAFFTQAGESRARAFILNVWYALGIISVFLVLAALGVGLSEMFTERLFGIIMAAVVFAMALSLMGLWELQVPSFLGSGKSLELAQKEGALGAFFKGIITTLLAIPCGAPLLSPALKWADEQVRSGTPANVYLAFAVIGLGMASPYLVIGAFPELLRFLPKPGAWMGTFQKAMGYLLLVAVVWILYFLPFEDVVPTVGLLFAIWLACWLIGRLPLTADAGTKLRTWGLALSVVAAAALICFPLWLRPAIHHRLDKLVAGEIQEGRHDEAVQSRFLALQIEKASGLAQSDPGALSLPDISGAVSQLRPDAAIPGVSPAPGPPHSGSDDEATLPWQPFNRALFERLVAAEKTVLIDFTADWCLTCKTLEALVLNTRETRQVVDRNGVVTLQADWTRGAPEVTEMMQILGSKQVPVVAIFPAGDPNRPIVLRGGYSRQSLLEALEKAGPSADVPASTSGRMLGEMSPVAVP